MQSFVKYTLALLLTAGALACGSSRKENLAALTEKKETLEVLKKEQVALQGKIAALEAEIAKLDTGAGSKAVARLVSIDTIGADGFTHYIDLQGRVSAEDISYITPRGMGGQVRAVYVKEGDRVRRGQVLLKLDDAIVRQNVAVAKQQMEATRTQLALAKSLYQRQKNLWEQNIGTEVQVLQAKTNMETLESNLKAQAENLKAAEEQLATTTVISNVNGIADEVNIHVGETFTGSPAQGIKIVNKSNLKVTTNIPENYLGRVSKGVPVQVTIPDVNKTFESKIAYVSQTVNPATGGFVAEANLPGGTSLKPNVTAIVRVLDYKKANAITIPVNILQNDEAGKFVYVASAENKGLVARKRPVQVGEFYADQLEITSGLQAGDIIVTDGYQNLYDGQPLTINR